MPSCPQSSLLLVNLNHGWPSTVAVPLLHGRDGPPEKILQPAKLELLHVHDHTLSCAFSTALRTCSGSLEILLSYSTTSCLFHSPLKNHMHSHTLTTHSQQRVMLLRESRRHQSRSTLLLYHHIHKLPAFVPAFSFLSDKNEQAPLLMLKAVHRYPKCCPYLPPYFLPSFPSSYLSSFSVWLSSRNFLTAHIFTPAYRHTTPSPKPFSDLTCLPSAPHLAISIRGNLSSHFHHPIRLKICIKGREISPVCSEVWRNGL